jgi:endonuclease/exonuclease/phosphatase family metal-dependent hydrolase
VSFRVATVNLERNEKRWSERRELFVDQLATLRPDIFALNEIWLPSKTGHWIQRAAEKKCGLAYTLVEQPKTAGPPQVEAEGLLTQFSIVERSHVFYSANDTVALVLRLNVEGRLIDVYVTHLYGSVREDSLRIAQVRQLIEWIGSRTDVNYKIVCGDFNATLAMESAKLMAENLHPTQTEPTAFTPLQEPKGDPSHKEWDRMDRCIDFIWITDSLRIRGSGLCFNQSAKNDPTLWPSDHVGVWADLGFV